MWATPARPPSSTRSPARRCGRSGSGGEFSSSPVVAEGRIYCPNQEGQTFVVTAVEPYEVIAENTLDEGCMASPAVYDGALYLRTKGHLYKIVKSE
jgi:hypothetical protein